ncbi:hypothetical protein G6F17_010803 [Rhizopus arrhizus]|nr:hypothetical protein G6F24_009834 [Rhizopus arrhizus]KAG0795859.1 hypothetical protein G6F22_005027 [Rhizopus arrhizus]KAG0807197.1 hypothetical protein G6F20_010551 [Rhizopus arrhizus]KAG0849398.1 hypothetical protein G6F17_010803 [Rhizopus arrhizus]KAG0906979.1 hypothetical protein G6F33_010955 [Rhizopus arrhizus]
MHEDVNRWVKSCEGCQRFKVRSDIKRPPMKPITPSFVGEVWATDIAVLPESHTGEKYLLVFMEYLTKWVVAVPLRSFETSSIVQVLLYEVVLKYGLPRRLISDNGANYISETMNVVCSRLGISRSLTSVEHPQSDGLVERINRTLKTSLSIVVGNDVKTWAQHLPFVVFAYNTARQASTKFSPFEVMFGRKATLPLLPSIEVGNPKTYATQQWSNFLNKEIPIIHARALENIMKAQEQQVQQYNKKTRELVKFKVGDLVLRKNHSKMMSFPKERWTGPWKVLEVTNRTGTAYRISRVQDPKATSTVNVVDLRLFYERGNDVVVPTLGGVSTSSPN